jgi:8-oxo-dGTP diphosphatase
MAISPYLAGLRRHVGTDLLLTSGVAGLVLDDTGRLLLQRRSDTGQWALPGGALDPGEAPAQAVVREVHEETGLLVRPRRLVGVMGPHRIVYPHGDQLEVTASVFVCTVVAGELRPLDGESTELAFHTLDEVPDAPFLRPYPLPTLLAVAEGAWFSWREEWLDGYEGTASADDPVSPRG